MFESLFDKNKKMPSKESIEEKKKKVEAEENHKKDTDCKLMYNLLNKTLNDAIKSNSNNIFYRTDIDRKKFNSYKYMNIANCSDFQNYKKELDERDVKYKYYESSNYNYISYDTIDKKLQVYGW